MSTSSNKQQKKGKDGMGKAGKGKEMVKDWCGASFVWKSMYGQVVLYACMYACMYVCMHVCMDGWMDVWMHIYICIYIYICVCIYVCLYGRSAGTLFFPQAERRHGRDEDGDEVGTWQNNRKLRLS